MFLLWLILTSPTEDITFQESFPWKQLKIQNICTLHDCSSLTKLCELGGRRFRQTIWVILFPLTHRKRGQWVTLVSSSGWAMWTMWGIRQTQTLIILAQPGLFSSASNGWQHHYGNKYNKQCVGFTYRWNSRPTIAIHCWVDQNSSFLKNGQHTSKQNQ